jgi:hypothetical protein
VKHLQDLEDILAQLAERKQDLTDKAIELKDEYHRLRRNDKYGHGSAGTLYPRVKEPQSLTSSLSVYWQLYIPKTQEELQRSPNPKHITKHLSKPLSKNFATPYPKKWLLQRCGEKDVDLVFEYELKLREIEIASTAIAGIFNAVRLARQRTATLHEAMKTDD